MKKFEYKISPIDIKNPNEIIDRLNAYLDIEGNDGWELVQWDFAPHTLFPPPNGYPFIMVFVTFKRELK